MCTSCESALDDNDDPLTDIGNCREAIRLLSSSARHFFCCCY